MPVLHLKVLHLHHPQVAALIECQLCVGIEKAKIPRYSASPLFLPSSSPPLLLLPPPFQERHVRFWRQASKPVDMGRYGDVVDVCQMACWCDSVTMKGSCISVRMCVRVCVNPL